MTMPQNDDFLAAVRAAFSRYDSDVADAVLPSALPEDVAKGLHFDPNLHPRNAIGRFAPSGNTAGLGAGKPGAGNRPKPNVKKPASGKHIGTAPHKPHGAPTSEAQNAKVSETKQRLKQEFGITTPEQLSEAMAQDSEHGRAVRDVVAGRKVPGFQDPMEREARVAAYRAQLTAARIDSRQRENQVSQFRDWLKQDQTMRDAAEKQVERTPNLPEAGYGFKRGDIVEFNNARGFGDQRGIVIGTDEFNNEPTIMVVDSDGNTQYVYPNEQASTIGHAYAPNGFPWGDAQFGKSLTGVFEAACAELDNARGIAKDQMMTGDVPTTVDGPASGRKKKRKGPGDCGPNGTHVPKG